MDWANGPLEFGVFKILFGVFLQKPVLPVSLAMEKSQSRVQPVETAHSPQISSTDVPQSPFFCNSASAYAPHF